MKPIQLIKTHAHHTISFDALEKIEWHLENLGTGWQVIKEISAKKHRKLHAKDRRGKPVKFYGATLGYMRGIG